jgi:hypothetical protein
VQGAVAIAEQHAQLLGRERENDVDLAVAIEVTDCGVERLPTDIVQEWRLRGPGSTSEEDGYPMRQEGDEVRSRVTIQIAHEDPTRGLTGITDATRGLDLQECAARLGGE